VAFDLELSGLPTHWTADGRSPVRVLCAAVARGALPSKTSEASEASQAIRVEGSSEVRVWRGAGTWMTAAELCAFIDTLDAAASRGETIVTWGGAGSDWRVLAAEVSWASPRHAALCRRLALDHVDVAFAAAASFGCMMGLRAACVGMNCLAKPPGASAAVPALWAAGRTDEVLRHVADDAVATAMVYARMFHGDPDHPQLTWMTTRNALKTWDAPVVRIRSMGSMGSTGSSGRGSLKSLEDARGVRLETVRECLASIEARGAPAAPTFLMGESMRPHTLAAWLGASSLGCKLET